jgi:hypothetical protein
MISEVNVSRLRVTAMVAMATGIAGSIGLFLRAGQRTPRLLLLGMAIWMLSPYVALVWANVLSKPWPILIRATLYCLMIVVAVGSLVVYGDDALGHRRAQAAFVYVIVPPVSWLIIAVAISMAAVLSRRGSRRGNGG